MINWGTQKAMLPYLGESECLPAYKGSEKSYRQLSSVSRLVLQGSLMSDLGLTDRLVELLCRGASPPLPRKKHHSGDSHRLIRLMKRTSD